VVITIVTGLGPQLKAMIRPGNLAHHGG